MSDTPSITASNLQYRHKGTLVAAVDIAIPKWGGLTFKGCLWHRKNDSEWVSFPSREWVDRNGQRQFADLIQFGDKATGARFKAAALTAVRELAGGDSR